MSNKVLLYRSVLLFCCLALFWMTMNIAKMLFDNNSDNSDSASRMNFRKLSVITWNIWFDRLEQHTRYEEILQICKRLEPDVICMQEVIPYFLEKVKATPYFTNKYSFSDPNLDGSTMEGYGVLIMTKKELNVKFSIVELPTVYGRKLVVAEIHKGNEIFAVGSVHLESMNTHPTREKQMEICNDILTKYDHSLLCGDFNFCSHSNYNGGRGPLENESLLRIMPEYTDVWSQLKPDNVGFTFDTSVNPMIGNREERMRYDRIVYRSTTNSGEAWKAARIGFIGDSPIKRTQSSPAANGSIWNSMFGQKSQLLTLHQSLPPIS